MRQSKAQVTEIRIKSVRIVLRLLFFFFFFFLFPTTFFWFFFLS